MTNRKTYKGKYKPLNPKKYKGDPTNIIYRSGWEKRVMVWLDSNPNILEWSSEELAIPYISPIDQRRHRYYPDFLVKAKLPDGTTKILMLEVKPAKETKEPIKQTKKTKRYLTEVVTWAINQAKWKRAQEYCIDKGWEFKILTESDLGIKYK